MSRKTLDNISSIKGQVKLNDKGRFIRKLLMDRTPEVGMSKNDLYNNGYGGCISISIGLVFMITFIYYAVTNSEYNKSAKFLVPAKGGEITGAMYCKSEAITLSNTYVIDTQSRWKSNTQFTLGDTMYGLEMINSQYRGIPAYSAAMATFADDLKVKSNRSVVNDYSWNLVFGGSYAVVAPTEGNGRSSLYIDADIRLMYDVSVYTAGISNINGTCIPDSFNFFYDGTNFNLKAYLNLTEDISEAAICPQLSISGSLERSMGLYDPYDEALSSIVSTNLKFDAAAISSAIAINYQIATLDALTPVPTLNNIYASAFVDSSYVPMEPVYCFNATEYGFDRFGVSDLCLVKYGEVFAFPVTSHFGSYSSTTFIPEACNCESPFPECFHYDIVLGLIFLPHDNYPEDILSDDAVMAYSLRALHTMIDKLLVFHEQAELAGLPLDQYLRPLMMAANQATYRITRGQPLIDEEALETVHDTFADICPECYVLAFELYDIPHYSNGATINKGGKSLVNLACTNVFYSASVLDTVISTPPSEITEDYLVCTDSLSTAVSTGISNAYASAGLYSSVVLAVVLFILKKYHDHVHRGTPINSTEEQEVVVRNAIADVLVFILNERTELTDTQKKYLEDRLNVISITDPLTHTENHNHLGKIAGLVKAPCCSGEKHNTVAVEVEAEKVVECVSSSNVEKYIASDV